MFISVANSTKKTPPITRRRLVQIFESCLPKNYDLSVAYIGRAAARRLNQETRGKDYATNILSFSYGKNEGELVLNLDSLNRDAKELSFKSRADVATYLLIHGALHLTGHDHSKKMDSREDDVLKKLGVCRLLK